MIYLALEYCIGIHGGGTHQWNLQYHEFQYMKRVSISIVNIVASFA